MYNKIITLFVSFVLIGCAYSSQEERASQECYRTGYSGFTAYIGCMHRWRESQGFSNSRQVTNTQDKLSNAAISSVICSAIAKDSASCIAGSLEGASGVSQNLEKQRIEKMEREIKKLKQETDELKWKRFRENLDKPR
jgi:hypothetical protein